MAKRKTVEPEKPNAILDLPVEFGTVTITGNVRIGIKVGRSDLRVTRIDELIGKRLIGRIVSRGGGGQAGQESIPGLPSTDVTVEGAFDVKRVGVGPKQLSFSVMFALGSIDVRELTHFPDTEGRLIVDSSEAIPLKERKGEDDEEDEDEDEDDDE